MGDGVGKAYGSANDTVGNVLQQVRTTEVPVFSFQRTSQFDCLTNPPTHRFELNSYSSVFYGSN